jgi:hypothetical protein
MVHEPPVMKDVIDVGELHDGALPSIHLPRQSLVNIVEDDDAVEEEEESVFDVELSTLPSFYSGNRLEVKNIPAESPSLVALCDLLASMTVSTHTHALPSDHAGIVAELVIEPLIPMIVVSGSSSLRALKSVRINIDSGSRLMLDDDSIPVSLRCNLSMFMRIVV